MVKIDLEKRNTELKEELKKLQKLRDKELKDAREQVKS